MCKPNIEIIKVYPVRGSCAQFRFAERVTFDCYGCKKSKIAKLIATFKNDWNKKICNGCYGEYIVLSGEI